MKPVFNIFLILMLAMGFQACSDDNDGNDDNGGDGSGLVLSVDRDTISINPLDQATFKVMYNGKDVTLASVITNEQDGIPLKGGIFSSKSAKEYSFFAEYSGRTSNKVKVQVVVDERLFQKNVLMQQVTSTTCIYCPDNHRILEILQELRPTMLFPICYHGSLSGPDPFEFPQIDVMFRELPVDGYGAIVFDYKYKLAGELEDLRNCMKARGDVGIALSTSLDAEQKTATIDVKIKSMIDVDYDSQLAVAIVENGLVGRQIQSNGTWINDYVHNEVVRVYLTDLLGDRVAAGEITRAGELKKQFSYTIAADYNVKNLQVVVYLLRNKQVVNCQSVKLGSNVDYQYVSYNPNDDPLPELE